MELQDGFGRNTLQRRIQQEQTLEDCLAEGNVCLLQPVLTLAKQLLLHMAVG